MIRICTTNKGSKKIVYEGYSFTKEKEKKEKIFWRCAQRKCLARLQTNVKIDEMTVAPGIHTCGAPKSDEQVEADEKFKKVMNCNIMSKPAQIITKFHGEFGKNVEFTSDTQLRNRITYQRRKLFGKSNSIKRDCIDNVIDNGIKTIDGHDFLLHKSEDDDIIIFGTEDNLERLFENNEWMADGTFSIAPKNYHQIYIISAKILGIWQPLFYALMTNRKENDYYQLWEILIKKAEEKNIDITEKPIILIDFEKASSNAFKTHFPDGSIIRCYFHFWQTLLKNLRKKNLYAEYIQNKDFGNNVKQIAALAYLPEDEVLSTFLDITYEGEERHQPFYKYFENTFIRGKCIRQIARTNKSVYAKSRYSINEWNIYNRFENDLTHTSNMQEARNRQLQACNFHGDHPTVYKLTTLLLDYNQRMIHNMESHIISGMPNPKKKRIDCEKEGNLRRLYKKYNAKEIGKMDYLFGCSGNIC